MVLTRLRQAGILWASVGALAAFGVLVGLGSWQLQRKQWKDGLQAQIDRRVREPARPLNALLAMAAKGQDITYARTRVDGRFLHSKRLFYFASGPHKPGWHLYIPFELDDGRFLMVNCGYLQDSRRADFERPKRPIGDRSSIVGLLRRPGTAGIFTPQNDVAKNIWYWRDLDGMVQASLGGRSAQVIPYFLEADARSSARIDGGLRGGVTNTRLTNRHLEYALTWFGLALTLIGVYVAFVWSRFAGIGGRRN